MKRTISILLCLILLFTIVCGCNNTSAGGNSSDKEPVSSKDDTSSKTDTSEDTSNEDVTSEEEIEYIYEEEDIGGAEKVSVPATTKKTFTTLPAEHTSLLRSNPDRGWRSEEIYNVSADLDVLKSQTYEKIFSGLEAEINGNTLMEKVTVSRVYFYMHEYKDMKVLPQETVDYIERVLRAYRELGVKAYMCIYYQRGLGETDYGAAANIILSHLDSYGKIWENNKDTIYAVCFALIGSYGEWTAIKPAMKTKDKQAIVDKVLELLPESTYLTMRMPDYKKEFVSVDNPRYKTIGFAQDAFFGKMFPYEDKGQSYWRPADDNAEWQMSIKESPYAVMDGELFTTNWFRNDAGGLYVEPYTSIQALSELHMTTLSIEHAYGDINRFGGDVKETVIYNWKCEEITAEKIKELGTLCTPTYFTDRNGKAADRNCFEYIRDFLGYHLSATDLAVTGGTKKGEKINLSMGLVNYGFSAAFNLKSGFAILDENNKVVSEIEVGDPTTWHSTDPDNYSDRTQLTHKLTAQMNLPKNAGTYKIAFFLRNNLGQTARLDNTVEYSDGYNILHMFTID